MKLMARRLLAVALLLPAIAAATEAYHWWQAATLNRSIVSENIVSQSGSLPAAGMVAKAYYLARKGERETALGLYKRAESDAAPQLKSLALYNAANIYLRQALALRGSGNEQQAPALLELAKENYREALRIDSQDWDARYNLERALRLAPEEEPEVATDNAAPKQSERAPTTMRGFTLGLP